MSFFGRSGGGAPPGGGPPGNYSRLPPNPGHNSPLPTNPRSSQRVPPPRMDDQYEKRRAPSPYGHQGHGAGRWVVDANSIKFAEAQALTTASLWVRAQTPHTRF